MLYDAKRLEDYIKKEYLPRIQDAKTHAAKVMVISEFLQTVFGVKLDEILPGIERKIRSKILGVRGSMDLSFTNVVIEVKTDIERELETGKNELKKYFQALLEEDPKRQYIGIITDGIKFKAYAPVIFGNIVLDVEQIDKEYGEIDLRKTPVNEAILWLDSFIFSSQKLRPTAKDLRRRFGPGSAAYHLVMNALKPAWKTVKNKKEVQLKYHLWEENMKIVYGSSPGEDIFLKHTYLVTLVKIILALRFSRGHIPATEFERVLSGEYLARFATIVEEDFFTWILEPEIKDKTIRAFQEVAKGLAKYDLTNVREDFFKEIYEEIVERKQRHRLGEYYTPRWVTELLLEEALKLTDAEIPKILDPACGSGSFLQAAIHRLKEKLHDRDDALDVILKSVVGVDINPLAVIIARANYILALGELFRAGTSIPVFLADAVKIPIPHREIYNYIPCLKYEVDDKHVILIPMRIARNRKLLSRVLSALRVAVSEYRKGNLGRDGARRLLMRELGGTDIDDHEKSIIRGTLKVLLDLVDEEMDGIWIFMLNNIYAPISLRSDRFDIVIGNPPWIAMRYIENPEYQEFVKKKVFEYGLLEKEEVHLFTQIEMATLFFVRTADLYLKDGGVIAFVMPHSVITGAKHHRKFKEFRKPRMKLIKILNFERVKPLFNVPSVALIARKGGKTEYPVQMVKYSGKLPEKNVDLNTALRHLSIEETTYSPPRLGEKSYYHDKFREGATIVPRNFYFVELVINPELGVNPRTPYVKTSSESVKSGKPPWKDIVMKGEVEREFLYWTLLGKDVYPFSFRPRLVVVPALPRGDKFKVFDVDELKSLGYPKMAAWLARAQEYWERFATPKARKSMPRLINNLDYRRKLSSQNPNKRYKVVYNQSGHAVAACVVSWEDKLVVDTGRENISVPIFITDYTTYYYETNDENEAHYLAAVLNSRVLSDIINFGERHISRRILEFPIPRFDERNPLHMRLAELSKEAHKRMKNYEFKHEGAAARRKEAREYLKDILDEIDRLVKELIGL